MPVNRKKSKKSKKILDKKIIEEYTNYNLI